MKNIIKVTSLTVLVAAAFLAVNMGSASADEGDEPIFTPVEVIEVDPCIFLDCGPVEPEVEPPCETIFDCIDIEVLEPWLPELPDAPVVPDAPDIPDEPDEPDAPDTPDTPDEPAEPDTPDTPDTPDEPDTPNTPDTPDTPDAPDEPDTPDTAAEGEASQPSSLPNAGTGTGSASSDGPSAMFLVVLGMAGLGTALAFTFAAWRMKRSQR